MGTHEEQNINAQRCSLSANVRYVISQRPICYQFCRIAAIYYMNMNSRSTAAPSTCARVALQESNASRLTHKWLQINLLKLLAPLHRHPLGQSPLSRLVSPPC